MPFGDSEPAPNAGTPGWRERMLAACVLLLATGLVLFEIGSKSLWYDEAFSANAALRSWGELLALVQTREVNMALYYGLLHAWMKFGNDDGYIRLLSAVFAVAAVGGTYLVGRRLLGGPIGLAAALLLAINAFAVHYAQEARSYALLLFLAVASVGLLLRALTKPTPLRWMVFALTAAAMPYAHLIGVTMWAVHAVAIATYRPRPPRRMLALAAAVPVIIVIPIMVISAANVSRGVTWVPSPTPRLFLESWISLLGSGVPRGTITSVGVALAISGTALAGYGAVTQLARRGSERWAGLLIISWVAIAILLTLAVSAIKPLFVVRYLVLVVPAISLLVALGIVRLRWRAFQTIAAVGFVALAAGGLWGWYREAPKPDWRTASAWLLARSQPSDRAIFEGDWGASLEFYAHQEGTDKNLPLRLWRLDPADASFPAALRAALPALHRDGHTLWVVSAESAPLNPMADPDFVALQGQYDVVAHATFDGVTITGLGPVAP